MSELEPTSAEADWGQVPVDGGSVAVGVGIPDDALAAMFAVIDAAEALDGSR